MKLLYHKTIGNKEEKLEMHFVFCNVEAILHSRPITKISDAARDTVPLTPSMLLMVSSQVDLPFLLILPLMNLMKMRNAREKDSTNCTN